MLPLAGRNVRVEVENPGGKLLPAVLWVPDGAAIRGAEAHRIDAKIRRLAARGFLVMVADYGHHDPALHGGIISQLLGRLVLIANVDRDRVGLLGIQRGATIALAVASVSRWPGALAIYDPAIPNGFDAEDVTKLPRTLVLVGADDSMGIATVHHLEALLRDRGRPHDVHFQEGVGPEPTEVDLEDAWNRATEFFEEYL